MTEELTTNPRLNWEMTTAPFPPPSCSNPACWTKARLLDVQAREPWCGPCGAVIIVNRLVENGKMDEVENEVGVILLPSPEGVPTPSCSNPACWTKARLLDVQAKEPWCGPCGAVIIVNRLVENGKMDEVENEVGVILLPSPEGVPTST